MKNGQITKEKIKKIMEIPGKVRGTVFQTDAEYIRAKKGEEGLARVKEELKKIDCPIDYENIKATGWYPIGLRLVSLLAIQKVFDFGAKDIEDMGNAAPKYSFIVKSLLKYFLSFPKTYKEAPNYWRKHYTVGILEGANYNLKEKYYTLHLKGFKIHPVLCAYLGGYFIRIGQFVLKGSDFQVKETKCMFRDDPYHEFVVRWK